MSTRSIVMLSLVAVICVAVIVLSALAREQLTAIFGPLPIREFTRILRFVPPRLMGPPEFFRRSPLWIATGRGIVSALASSAFIFLVGLLTLYAFPRQIRIVRDSYTHGAGDLLRMLGIGACSALVLVLLTALGVLTLAAFPLSLVLLLVLLLAVWAGLIGLALALGRSINRWAALKDPSPVLDLVFGTLVLFTLTRIPIAGAVFLALISMVALGALIATRF